MGNTQASREWKKQKNTSLFKRLKPQQQRLAKHIFITFISLGITTALTVLVVNAFIKLSHQKNLKEIDNLFINSQENLSSKIEESDDSVVDIAKQDMQQPQ
jgi:hypothetical protein